MAAVVYAAPVAHAQSCNEITALPVTLDTPGKWCVTRDLSWQNPSAPAIHITETVSSQWFSQSSADWHQSR